MQQISRLLISEYSLNERIYIREGISNWIEDKGTTNTNRPWHHWREISRIKKLILFYTFVWLMKVM